MLISLNNIETHYTWLIYSEKYKSFEEEGYDLNNLIFVPDDCMKNDTNIDSFNDVILMCNVISYWVIDFPETFNDFCFNNQKNLLTFLQPRKTNSTIKYVYNNLMQSCNIQFNILKDYHYNSNDTPNIKFSRVGIMYEITKTGNLIKYRHLFGNSFRLKYVNDFLLKKEDLKKLIECILFNEELIIPSFVYKYIKDKWYLSFIYSWEPYKLLVTNFNKNSICQNLLKLGNDIGYDF